MSLKQELITGDVRTATDTARHGGLRVLAKLMSCEVAGSRRAVTTHRTPEHRHAASVESEMFPHVTLAFRPERALRAEETIRHQLLIFTTLEPRAAVIQRPAQHVW